MRKNIWLLGFLLCSLLWLWACFDRYSPASREAQATATLILQPTTPSAITAPLQTIYISALTPGPTCTYQPTPTPEPTIEPTPEGLLGGRFDGFSYTGERITDNEYSSEHVCIRVYHASDKTSYKGSIDYHVADIYLQDVTLLKTGSAGPDFTSPRYGTKVWRHFGGLRRLLRCEQWHSDTKWYYLLSAKAQTKYLRSVSGWIYENLHGG